MFSWAKVNGSFSNVRIYESVSGKAVDFLPTNNSGSFGSEYNGKLFRIWGRMFTAKITINY